MNFSAAAQLVMDIGESEARHLESGALDVEHLVIGLLKVGDLESPPGGVSGADWEQARQEVQTLGAHWKQARVNPVQMRRRLRFLVSERKPTGSPPTGGRSRRCELVLERARALAGGDQVGLAALLRACLEQDSEPVDQMFREFATDKMALALDSGPASGTAGSDRSGPRGEPASFQESRFAGYGRDLSALARAGKLDPVVGRREELKDLGRILNQSIRNNAMLVGEAGVGKTAVVEGLAQYAARPDAHEAVRRFHFVEITLASLLAGAHGGGDAAGRLMEVLKAAESDPDLVLFFDEFHALAGAADILKPTLARGQVHCLGATTIEEYHKHIETYPALARRFQRVWIGEPSRDETVQILYGLRDKLQRHHGLQLPDATIEAAVDLTARHILSGRLPDKAIIVLDQACALARIQTFSPSSTPMPRELSVETVAEIVAKQAQLPVGRILATDRNRLARLDVTVADAEKALGERVIGQPLAVSTLARALQRIDTGLEQEGRPFVAMFAGPSGVGKTELAKALSALMFGEEDRLITLDMVMYHEAHMRAQLIGSPPGYVDSDKVPQWLTDIEKQPNSIVLLDELEKAHPDVVTVFMPVFDEGRLVTAQGKVVDFSHAIFVLTSNLGTGHRQPHVGFPLRGEGAEEEQRQREAELLEYQIKQAISAAIRPEILNRIDATIVFQPLSRDALYRILDLHLAKLNKRRGLAQRGITLALDGSARDFLIDQAYSPEMGARELFRQLDRWVVSKFAQSVADFPPGSSVVCRRRGDAIEFELEGAHESPPGPSLATHP